MRFGDYVPHRSASDGRDDVRRGARPPRTMVRLAFGAAASAVVVALVAGGTADGVTVTTKKPTKTTVKASTKTTVKASTKSTVKATTKTSVPSETTTTKAADAATTTINVRPVTESSTTTLKAGTGASTTTSPLKSLKGTVFIPGAGRVLDLGANEVAKLAAGGRVETDVRGASGLAASGTGTVIVDVTVSNPTTPGRVTLVPVAPDFARSVVAASVGFQAGSTTVSRVAVPVGSNGLVRVNTTAGPSGLAISVVGWVLSAPAGTVEPSAIPLESCRILDTATGLGGLQGEITPARPFDLPAVGIAKVPAALTTAAAAPSAVILNVSASQASGPLELRVIPTGAETPELKLSMNPGQSSSATFVVPVGSDARAAFYVSAAGTQVAVDVVGWLDRDNAARSGGPC
jgi:hypothetical protein